MTMTQMTASEAVATKTLPPKMTGEKVCVFYGDKQALFDVDLSIEANQVTSLIGPKCHFPAIPVA